MVTLTHADFTAKDARLYGYVHARTAWFYLSLSLFLMQGYSGLELRFSVMTCFVYMLAVLLAEFKGTTTFVPQYRKCMFLSWHIYDSNAGSLLVPGSDL